MRDRVLISIDLEMTSPRPETQEIIEVAAVKFQDERIVDSFATLVQPPVQAYADLRLDEGPVALTKPPPIRCPVSRCGST